MQSDALPRLLLSLGYTPATPREVRGPGLVLRLPDGNAVGLPRAWWGDVWLGMQRQ